MSIRDARGRPIHLDLLRIRLPVGGVMSIAHRVSGVVLALALPLVLALLDRSLRDPESHARIAAALHAPGGRVLLFLGLWALLHHLLAGLRHLLIDLDLGVTRAAARRSAAAVLAAAPLLALMFTWSLLA